MKTRTIICDIDGVIFEHKGMPAGIQWMDASKLLPGVKESFDAWEAESATIILMTARRESCRKRLVAALQSHGLFWDHLIMGVGHGERIIINDKKPGGAISCFARNVDRNAGL